MGQFSTEIYIPPGSTLSGNQQLATLRKQGDEFQRLMRGINDALAVEALQAVADALRKDWDAAGLPPGGAAAIAQNFTGLAETLAEGLDDIAALKSEPAVGITSENAMAYLYLYPHSTIGAIAIGICIELIPLLGIILGFAILMQRPARVNTPDAANSNTRLSTNAEESADSRNSKAQRLH